MDKLYELILDKIDKKIINKSVYICIGLCGYIISGL